MPFKVPSNYKAKALLRSFQENPVHVTPILWLLIHLSVRDLVHNDEVKQQLVNGYNVLPSIVLDHARYECLREEEARNPKHFGCSFLDPLRQELDTIQQILRPAC